MRRTLLATAAVMALSIAARPPGLPTAAPAHAASLAPQALPLKVAPAPAGAGKPFLHDEALPVGYVEREVLISGQGAVYDYDAAGKVVVSQAEVPYTTRLLVRYPADPKRFSGAVILEALHPELGEQFVWYEGKDYIAGAGHAYVQVSTRRSNLAYGTGDVISRIKAFDPVRYDALDFPEGGQTWDILSQAGRLVRSRDARNPLSPLPVNKVLLAGWSGAGALTLFYIGDGFAQSARLADGKPIFDGYFVGEPSWYPRINSKRDELPHSDPRQKVQPRDVPAITLHSSQFTEMENIAYRVRADSDAANDRYRRYEVPGGDHGGDPRRLMNPEIRASLASCDHPTSQFPLHHYVNLSLDYLLHWNDQAPPPHGAPITRDPDGKVKVDAVGNPVGGIRSVSLDVPSTRYFLNTGAKPTCARQVAQAPFDHDQMKSLYGTKAVYVAKVKASANALVAQGWLLRRDADEEIRNAQAVADF